MTKLIVANWKMNGSFAKIEADLTSYLTNSITNQKNVVLSIPLVYLAKAKQLLQTGAMALASQDISKFASAGAYTGETSAAMLCDIGVDYVLIGHSERREYFKETEEVLLSKLENALANQLKPIFCFGEALEVRQSNQYLAFLAKQLAVFAKLNTKPAEIVLAYEPIWAIGTGLTASIDQIKEALEFSAKTAAQYFPNSKVTLLYGGSVGANNAAEILSLAAVEGVLVGGASLKVADFTHICSQVNS